MLHAPSIAGEGGEPSPIRLRAISLGAGVQSTTLALMAAHGEMGPMPDCAIFADTGWEPKAVYEHLDWLMSPNVLPFPVHIVSAGNIREQLVQAGEGNRWASIPAFAKIVTPAGAEIPVLDEDEEGELVEVARRRTTTETVAIGMIRRQCTSDVKIVPIRRKIRELVGFTRKRETVTGTSWHPKSGGKGGNQAVSSARTGIATSMIGAVADDEFGRFLIANLGRKNVDHTFVRRSASQSTGRSVAIFDAEGDYGAVIVSGSNRERNEHPTF